MEQLLTLDMVLALPDEILKKAEIFSDNNVLLMKEILDEVDLKIIRADIDKIMRKYKSLRCLYSLPMNNTGNITSRYDVNSGIRSGNPASLVDNFVTNKVDSQIWLYDFYQTMLIAAVKLTKDEAVYIVEALFHGENEDVIAYNLSICKQTLQKVKKSSLIKVWVELQEFDNYCKKVS